MFNRLSQYIKTQRLTQLVGSLSLQIGSIGIVVVTNLMLAWWLSTSAFANYAYLLSWVQLLTNIALFGLYDVQLKEMGSLVINRDVSAQVSLFRQVIIGTILISLGLMLGFIGLSFVAKTSILYVNKSAVLLIALQIPLMAIIFQVQATIRCYAKSSIGLLVEKIFRPLLIGFFTCTAYFLAYDNTTLSGVALTSTATVLSLLLSLFLLFKYTNLTPTLLIQKPLTKFGINRAEQFWFWSVGLVGLFFIRLDTILLGELGHIESVGIYSVATKFSDLTGFVMQTANYVFVPVYAVLYQSKQIAEFQTLVTRNTRIVAAITIGIYVIILLAGKYILAAHGASYIEGYPVFILLSTTILATVLLGDNYYVLMMCGFGKIAYTCIFIGFAVALCLEWLLIPQYSMLGAVVGRSIGTLVWYISSAVMVRHKTGVMPSVIGVKRV